MKTVPRDQEGRHIGQQQKKEWMNLWDKKQQKIKGNWQMQKMCRHKDGRAVCNITENPTECVSFCFNI